MKAKYLVGFSIIIFSLVCLASEKKIICDAPRGTRIDYFSHNNINLKNQTFLMGRDSVAAMKPKIILTDSNKVISFIIGDTALSKAAAEKSGNMQVLIYNEDQISFAGVVNNAPILATYYPKLGILIYSQQSIWSGEHYQGARAVIFYSKCKLETLF